MKKTNAELLTKILEIADKHPHTNLSKLIKCFETEKKIKNIVLLLAELAEHAVFGSDVSISLKYYLDSFERLSEEPTFSEAGLVLLNSAIIYGKRVDHVHQYVERLLLSLSSLQNLESEGSNSEAHSPLKKRSRKRHLEHLSGRHEADMTIKRFKIVSDKRFEDNISVAKNNRNNIMNSYNIFVDAGISNLACLDKQHIYPIAWLNSVVKDFDYEEETDSKKNYKLFTYHLEHRYNTIIVDINLKMYFKMKDFFAECADPTIPGSWPPLSDAYIDQYVNVEDRILCREGIILGRELCQIKNVTAFETTKNVQYLKEIKSMEQHIDFSHQLSDISKTCSLQRNNLLNDLQNLESEIGSDEDSEMPVLNEKLLEISSSIDIPKTKDTYESSHVEDLFTVKLKLPYSDDGETFFSELPENSQQTLSPAKVEQDFLQCLSDKSNIVVKVDEEIKNLFRTKQPRSELLSLPFYAREELSLRLNILKIPIVFLKKRCKFKLGLEFNQRKKERLKKYVRCSNVTRSKSWARLGKDVFGVYVSPISTPTHDPVFFGFPEESSVDKSRTFSQDSGISLQITEREIQEDLPQSKGSLNETSTVSDFRVPEHSQMKMTPDHRENINKSSDAVRDMLAKQSPKFILTKVQEWFNHLHPILSHSRNRHHFNVFDLGTEVMSKFDESCSTHGQVTLKHVMEQKDRSFVSRYFLSTLLLVNQGNIEMEVFNKDLDQPAELQDVRIKLKSTKRYKVSLKDNIGLPNPLTSITKHIGQKYIYNKVRTLKSVPEVPRVDDGDSGIAMSEGTSNND